MANLCALSEADRGWRVNCQSGSRIDKRARVRMRPPRLETTVSEFTFVSFIPVRTFQGKLPTSTLPFTFLTLQHHYQKAPPTSSLTSANWRIRRTRHSQPPIWQETITDPRSFSTGTSRSLPLHLRTRWKRVRTAGLTLSRLKVECLVWSVTEYVNFVGVRLCRIAGRG
jgi:hypothetical protein